MEPALESVCKDIRIGKILIQTNYDTDEPEVSRLCTWAARVANVWYTWAISVTRVGRACANPYA